MSVNLPWHKKRWQPFIDWETPPGNLLRRTAVVLAEKRPDIRQILLFGSVPLQLGVSSAIMSGDLDIASDDDLHRTLTGAGLTKGHSSPYVEVCPLGTFRTALDWRSRAWVETLSGIQIWFPHPIDILISKIRRGEEKDMEAFEEVIRAIGHPIEEELRDALIHAVHLYEPGYDESATSAPIPNTLALWLRLFGRPIDVRQEIIVPGLQQKPAAIPDNA